MKKILLAIDYNPAAENITETGYALARALNAEVTLAHVISEPACYPEYSFPIMGFDGFNSDCAFESIEEQQNEAARFLSSVVIHLGGENIKTTVLTGKTSEAILQYADEYKADLIIMGTQSHAGFEKIVRGDAVAKVLKHAAIPVLIVPPNKQETEQTIEHREMHLYI
jgi:nucleotide-binding universal stress UspA family protein